MNIQTPETIRVSKTISSNTTVFRLFTEKIDFNDKRPLL